DAAADLEEVRRRLGYARISLYGVSYGTRMAQAYMRRYPSRVRSAVLDGVVPFDVAIPLTYAASAELAIERIWAACRDLGSCGGHPGADFDRLLGMLDKGTVAAQLSNGSRVRMNRGDFGYAVRGILYSANAATLLPGMVQRAAASGSLDEFATAYWSRE